MFVPFLQGTNQLKAGGCLTFLPDTVLHAPLERLGSTHPLQVVNIGNYRHFCNTITASALAFRVLCLGHFNENLLCVFDFTYSISMAVQDVVLRICSEQIDQYFQGYFKNWRKAKQQTKTKEIEWSLPWSLMVTLPSCCLEKWALVVVSKRVMGVNLFQRILFLPRFYFPPEKIEVCFPKWPESGFRPTVIGRTIMMLGNTTVWVRVVWCVCGLACSFYLH